MKEVGKTWSIGNLPLAVTDDSEDYHKARIGQLGVLDTLYTEQHNMGTESQHRDLTAYILSGYENGLLPMIEAGGYNTLISDQGDEGDYYIVACNPTHKQALNKPAEVYGVKLELVREPSPSVPVWPGTVYFAGGSGVYRTDTFGVSKTSDPAWAEISSTGRSGTIQYFALDNTQDTGELWVKTSAGSVYKFNGTSWSTVLTLADAQAFDVNAIMATVVNDPVTGYIYAWCRRGENAAKYRTWIDIHDGNGFQILTSSQLFQGSYNWLRGLGDYSVYNGVHTLDYTANISSYQHRLNYSYNGSTWATHTLAASANTNSISFLDNTDATTVYCTHSTSVKMYRAVIATSFAGVCPTSAPINCFDRLADDRRNNFRFMSHPDDGSIVRFIPNYSIEGYLLTTPDKFTTYTNQGKLDVGSSKAVTYIVPRVNTKDWDMIIYGAYGAYVSSPHNIYTAYGDTDLTPTGKSGAMAGTSPYTDSIPYTVGRPVPGGIQFIDFVEE